MFLKNNRWDVKQYKMDIFDDFSFFRIKWQLTSDVILGNKWVLILVKSAYQDKQRQNRMGDNPTPLDRTIRRSQIDRDLVYKVMYFTNSAALRVQFP